MPFAKVYRKYCMQRPLCAVCLNTPAAVNYIKEGNRHYRKLCDKCIRQGKELKPKPPSWFKAGYRKKPICEKCGYGAKFPEKQMTVFHVDGNLKNCQTLNLRTICLNCRVELANTRTPWKESPLTPDF